MRIKSSNICEEKNKSSFSERKTIFLEQKMSTVYGSSTHTIAKQDKNDFCLFFLLKKFWD